MRSSTRAILGVLTFIGGVAPSLATKDEERTLSHFAAQDPPDDSHWSTVGGPQELTFFVHALSMYKGNLVAGGEFLWISGRRVNAIAAWTGSTWEPFGQGVDHGGCPGIPCYPRVLALLPFGDDLIVGGNFIRAGGQPANYIARWDGTSWHPLGQGVDDQVFALAEYQGDIIAAGLFLNAGGQPANHIARWDGASWHTLGQGSNRNVNDLEVFDDRLIVGGSFGTVGQDSIRNIAAWNGANWEAMDNGSLQRPDCFGQFEGQLIAGGVFQDPETLQEFRIARWDGRSWIQFGPAEPSRPTHALAVYRGTLVRGFSGFVHNIERWDGVAWHPLGSGTDKFVLALCPTETSLYVGGAFLVAGGKTAWFIARWDDVITPVVIQDLVAVAEGDAVRISWRLSREAMQELRWIFVEGADARSGPYVDLTHSPLLPDLEMSFTDTGPYSGRSRWYRLRLAMRDGSVSTAGPVEGHVSTLSYAFLAQPMDLHADGPVAIRYRIGGQTIAPVRLEIFTPTGKLLRVLHQGVAGPGEHLLTWDRRSESGSPVARGVYCVRLATEGTQAARKLVLLHR